MQSLKTAHPFQRPNDVRDRFSSMFSTKRVKTTQIFQSAAAAVARERRMRLLADAKPMTPSWYSI